MFRGGSSVVVIVAVAGLFIGTAAPAGADGFISGTSIPKFTKSPRSSGSRGSSVPAPLPGSLAFQQGAQLFEAGDYAGALPFLEQAVEQAPDNAIYRRRYALCLSRLNRHDEALQQINEALARPGLRSESKEDLRSTAQDIQEEINQENARRANDALNEISNDQAIGATREANAELDSISAHQVLDSLENDSRVVDARGPKPYEQVIRDIPELADSPAAERARKGLAAAANHDWKVALAWYQDALNHDPGNPVLVRAVDLADWMVKHREGRSALSSVISTISGQRTLLNLDSSDPRRRAQAIVDAFGQEADDIARRDSDGRLSDWDRAFRDRALDELLKQKVEAAEFADAIEKAKTAGR